MKNIGIFASTLATTVLLQACGVSPSTKTESKRTAGTGVVKMGPGYANNEPEAASSMDPVAAVESDAALHITEAYLTEQLATAEATQASKAVAPIAEVKPTSEKIEMTAAAPEAKAPSSSDALATAHTKIDEAFAAKMKQYPNAFSPAEAEFIKAQLNLFVKQSVSKDTAAATATWNGITTRLNQIKSSKQQGLALTHGVGNLSCQREVGYVGCGRRGGLLTTLIGAVGRVLNVGVRLVAEIVSVTVPTILETAVELVDTVFCVLI